MFLALKRFLPHLRVGQDGQHDCGLEPESPKWTTFSATVQVGKACSFLSTVSVGQNSPCPRSYEHRSLNIKTGLGGRRMDVTPSWSEDLPSRLVCFEHDYTLPALVRPVSSVASECGLSGTRLYGFPPIRYVKVLWYIVPIATAMAA